MTTPVTNNSSTDNPYAVVNGSSSSSSGSGKTVDPNSAQGIQDRFLTLLTAQLKAQDPSNPMDNNQITSQMAQISSVTGMENLNQSMKAMLQSQVQSQSLIAAGTVGRQALVDGNDFQWDANTNGTPTVGAVSLDSAATNATVTVKNAAGQTVTVLAIDKPTAGMNLFAWNGKDATGAVQPAGTYTYEVVATTPGETGVTQVKSTAYSFKTIGGVTWDSNGTPQLVLNNGKRVGLSDVQQIS